MDYYQLIKEQAIIYAQLRKQYPDKEKLELWKLALARWKTNN